MIKSGSGFKNTSDEADIPIEVACLWAYREHQHHKLILIGRSYTQERVICRDRNEAINKSDNQHLLVIKNKNNRQQDWKISRDL